MRKTYLKKTQESYDDEEPEVDMSDIDLPPEIKQAKRPLLDPVVAGFAMSI